MLSVAALRTDKLILFYVFVLLSGICRTALCHSAVLVVCLERTCAHFSTKRGMKRASFSGRTAKYYYDRVGGHWKITAASDPTANMQF